RGASILMRLCGYPPDGGAAPSVSTGDLLPAQAFELRSEPCHFCLDARCLLLGGLARFLRRLAGRRLTDGLLFRRLSCFGLAKRLVLGGLASLRLADGPLRLAVGSLFLLLQVQQ